MSAVAQYPVLPFLAAAVAVLLLPRRVVPWVALAAPVVALVQIAGLPQGTTAGFDYYGFGLEYLRLDGLSSPFAGVFCVAALLAYLYGVSSLTRREWCAALTTAGCALGVVLAGDLMTLFVMWEVKALGSTMLIAGDDPVRRGAALRYVVAHVLGGSMLLGGVVWHLSSGGSLAFDAFDPSAGSARMVLVAFLLAAAMPPLHAWLPDAYPSASVAGTVVLAAFTTKAAVYALLRGFGGYELLVGLGVLMALYGVVYAVIENDIRRLLGYHIVSQVGFMVAGVGLVAEQAVNGATAHAVAHILYKGLLLMGAGAVIMATGAGRLSDLGGLWRRMPLVFVCTTVGALSIAGVPLFSGFVSKELVIAAGSSAGQSWAVQGLKLASVGTFLSVVVKLLWFTFGARDSGLAPRRLPTTMLVAMVGAAALNIVIGVWPTPFYELMPTEVDYAPFTTQKLVEAVQLLGLAALASLLLIRRLSPTRGTSLDVDWAYRAAPVYVAEALGPTARRLRRAPRLRGAVAGTRRRVSAAWWRLGREGYPGATPSTTTLGMAMLAALLVVLVRSVTP